MLIFDRGTGVGSEERVQLRPSGRGDRKYTLAEWIARCGVTKFDGRLALMAPGLSTYLEGGGHWSWFMQYLLGLRDLGVDFYWLEFLPTRVVPKLTRRG